MERDLAELRDRTLQIAEHAEPDAAALGRTAAHFLELMRRTMDGEPASPEDQLTKLPPAELASLVKQRREAAELSLRGLADRTGLAPNTIRHLERGKKAPARKTLTRLLAIPELGLGVPTDPYAGSPRPHAWIMPEYNRSALFHHMRELLEADGGRIEQTYLYLDDESAADWLALSTSPGVLKTFRALPFDELARDVMTVAGSAPLEVVALGPGDGRSEVALTAAILRCRPGLVVQLHLLDISHSLLVLAYERALKELGPGVCVELLHGDFRYIRRYPLLRRQKAAGRQRLFLLLGGTLANVENEIAFLREGLGQTVPGDLAILDFQIAWADARSPEQVRAADPVFRNAPSEPNVRWFSGPLRRYAGKLTSLRTGADLVIDCPIRGSYEIDIHADVVRDGEAHRFHLVRVRRYEPEQLLETLGRLGWSCVAWHRYGPEQRAGVAVLRKT